MELELDLRENDFDAISGPPGFAGSGDMQQFSQMINVIRDIDLGGQKPVTVHSFQSARLTGRCSGGK